MNQKWHWTAEQDALIRDYALAGRSTREMAATLGCSRQFALTRAKQLGVMAPRHVGPAERPSRSLYARDYPRDDRPLPAGHPDSWGLLTRGTCLEGEPYG